MPWGLWGGEAGQVLPQAHATSTTTYIIYQSVWSTATPPTGSMKYELMCRCSTADLTSSLPGCLLTDCACNVTWSTSKAQPQALDSQVSTTIPCIDLSIYRVQIVACTLYSGYPACTVGTPVKYIAPRGKLKQALITTDRLLVSRLHFTPGEEQKRS